MESLEEEGESIFPGFRWRGGGKVQFLLPPFVHYKRARLGSTVHL